MSILDAVFVFSNHQNIAAANNATSNSTNNINNGLGKDAWGSNKQIGSEGGSLWLYALVTANMTTGGNNANLTVSLISSNNADWSNNVTLATKTTTLTSATPVKGNYLIRQPIAPGMMQYAEVVYTLAGGGAAGNVTAGNVLTWLGLGTGTPIATTSA